MKLNDLILIVIILLIVGIILIFNKKEIPNQAKVYYENDLILTIDLSQNKEYDVQKYL